MTDGDLREMISLHVRTPDVNQECVVSRDFFERILTEITGTLGRKEKLSVRCLRLSLKRTLHIEGYDDPLIVLHRDPSLFHEALRKETYRRHGLQIQVVTVWAESRPSLVETLGNFLAERELLPIEVERHVLAELSLSDSEIYRILEEFQTSHPQFPREELYLMFKWLQTRWYVEDESDIEARDPAWREKIEADIARADDPLVKAVLQRLRDDYGK